MKGGGGGGGGSKGGAPPSPAILVLDVQGVILLGPPLAAGQSRVAAESMPVLSESPPILEDTTRAMISIIQMTRIVEVPLCPLLSIRPRETSSSRPVRNGHRSRASPRRGGGGSNPARYCLCMGSPSRILTGQWAVLGVASIDESLARIRCG